MAASKKSKPQTKTGFILGLPAEMSPKEVVSKAKEAGIELSEKYVSTIRSNARAKKKAKRAAAKAAPAKKVATKVSKKAAAKNAVEAAPASTFVPTATDFIASQPRDLPAAAVVKAAKKAGLKIEAGYVYKVRSRLAAKAPKTPAPKQTAPKLEAAPKAPTTETAPAKTATAPKPAAKATTSNIEGSFKRLVVELGVARATELVGEVQRTLAELFGAS